MYFKTDRVQGFDVSLKRKFNEIIIRPIFELEVEDIQTINFLLHFFFVYAY